MCIKLEDSLLFTRLTQIRLLNTSTFWLILFSFSALSILNPLVLVYYSVNLWVGRFTLAQTSSPIALSAVYLNYLSRFFPATSKNLPIFQCGSKRERGHIFMHSWSCGWQACSEEVLAGGQQRTQRNESLRQARASSGHTQTSATLRLVQEQSLKTMARTKYKIRGQRWRIRETGVKGKHHAPLPTVGLSAAETWKALLYCLFRHTCHSLKWDHYQFMKSKKMSWHETLPFKVRTRALGLLMFIRTLTYEVRFWSVKLELLLPFRWNENMHEGKHEVSG